MSLPKDGGLAFPGDRYEDMQLDSSGTVVKAKATYPGMSLRDYFAGQALVAFSSAEMLAAIRDECKSIGRETEEGMARFAYSLADAMLTQRSK